MVELERKFHKTNFHTLKQTMFQTQNLTCSHHHTMENKTSLCIELKLLLITLTCSAIVLIYNIRLSGRKSRRPPLPPGPLAYPILGCIPQMLINKPFFRWIHQLMEQFNTEIACIRLCSTHVVTVSCPQIAREFLRDHDRFFASRPVFMSAKVVSNGYLTTVLSPLGDQWIKMRKILVSDVLSSRMHHWLHDKRCEEADHLVRYIYNQCSNPPLTNGLVNVRVAGRHYCGNLIRRLIFNKRFIGGGTEDGGPGVEEKEQVDAFFSILEHVYGYCIADYVPWLENFDLDGYKKSLRKAMKSASKYHDSEIDERVEMWRKGEREVEEDILDVMINLKDSENKPLLTIQELKAQIVEIMLGVVDNPSNSIEWALAEMINQPDILERAVQELDRVVGKDRLVQESDMPKLNFVKACAKEALRLHPVSPLNPPHVSTEDTIVAGYFIPKGSHVVLSRLAIGRNPKVWKDPLRYNPNRHINADNSEIVLTDNDLNVLSFSTGRRGCPATRLGSTMMVVLFARIIHSFTWRSESGDGQRVSLAQSHEDMFMVKPLIVHATPRLNNQVYMDIS